MTRTVEEDRVQIGTLKALGYTKGKILSYYLGYSLSATLIGSFAGAFLGFITLPSVIANAYGMMYTLPPRSDAHTVGICSDRDTDRGAHDYACDSLGMPARAFGKAVPAHASPRSQVRQTHTA